MIDVDEKTMPILLSLNIQCIYILYIHNWTGFSKRKRDYRLTQVEVHVSHITQYTMYIYIIHT